MFEIAKFSDNYLSSRFLHYSIHDHSITLIKVRYHTLILECYTFGIGAFAAIKNEIIFFHIEIAYNVSKRVKIRTKQADLHRVFWRYVYLYLLLLKQPSEKPCI